MNYDTQNFKLLKNQEIAEGIFDWTVENRELSSIAKCGQFAHVKVPGKMLRRPISICDATENTLRLVFQVKGEGTEIMSKIKTGEEVEILAPLGNGFKVEKGKKYYVRVRAYKNVNGSKIYGKKSNIKSVKAK